MHINEPFPFFRRGFLDAVRVCPGLRYNDLQVRISIAANPEPWGINVEAVRLERFDGEPRYNRQELKGNIVLAFKVRSKHSRVRFDVRGSVTLQEGDLDGVSMGGWYRGARYQKALQGAYKIANALSDWTPVESFGWTVSPEIEHLCPGFPGQ